MSEARYGLGTGQVPPSVRTNGNLPNDPWRWGLSHLPARRLSSEARRTPASGLAASIWWVRLPSSEDRAQPRRPTGRTVLCALSLSSSRQAPYSENAASGSPIQPATRGGDRAAAWRALVDAGQDEPAAPEQEQHAERRLGPQRRREAHHHDGCHHEQETASAVLRAPGGMCSTVRAVAAQALCPHRPRPPAEPTTTREQRQAAPRTGPQDAQWVPGDAPSQALRWAVQSVAKAWVGLTPFLMEGSGRRRYPPLRSCRGSGRSTSVPTCTTAGAAAGSGSSCWARRACRIPVPPLGRGPDVMPRCG
jgi:hypothetical protein